MQATATQRVIPVSIGALVAMLAVALLLAAPVAAAATLTTTLTGAAEVPLPADPDGTGSAVVVINAAAGTICYTITASNIEAPTAAHIHGAAAGVNGDVEITLTTPASSALAGPYTSNDCADAGDYVLDSAGDFATPALLLADIEANPQNYYVNVHNATFDGGAVRGQLALSTAPATTASSYINPDTGAATANPNVNANSSCETPDQTDTQQVSPAGSTANNVHNDACLFDALGFDVDAQVSFDSSGVGVISGCPDPDGAGPKTATNSGTRCTLSGYQETGAMGDFEYHARLNSQVPGTQTVVFCLDPEGNGCADATIKSSITIVWFKPVNIMVMKHNCAKVNTAAQFLAVEARAATNPTTPNAAFGKTVETVLECPTVVRPGNTQTPGAVAGGTSTFEFTVGGNIDTAKTLSTEGAFTQTALCEDDVMYDANRNGALNDNVCLDLSHYAFTVNSDGTVTITETAPPAGFSFGALRFTPGTGDDATLVSASNGVIRLNITNDADGMVMLHVYNFAVAAAATPTPTPTPTPVARLLPNTTFEDGSTDSTPMAPILALLVVGSLGFLGYRTLAARRTR